MHPKKATILSPSVVPCKQCGQQFRAEVKRVFDGRQVRNEFCSGHCRAACLNKGVVGHPRWNGGKALRPDGYVTLWSITGKRILEHRFMMEQKIGRKLKSSELVHHKNHNRSDNRISNLEIVNRAQHASMHHRGKSLTELHKQRIRTSIKRRFEKAT